MSESSEKKTCDFVDTDSKLNNHEVYNLNHTHSHSNQTGHGHTHEPMNGPGSFVNREKRKSKEAGKKKRFFLHE